MSTGELARVCGICYEDLWIDENRVRDGENGEKPAFDDPAREIDSTSPKDDVVVAHAGGEQHPYHLHCIFQWIQKEESCPTCRKHIREYQWDPMDRGGKRIPRRWSLHLLWQWLRPGSGLNERCAALRRQITAVAVFICQILAAILFILVQILLCILLLIGYVFRAWLLR